MRRAVIDPNTLSLVTQMLTPSNANTVMLGLGLVRTHDDAAPREALLKDVVYQSGDEWQNGKAA